MKTFSKITQKTAHNFFFKLNYFYIILNINKPRPTATQDGLYTKETKTFMFAWGGT